MLLLKMTKEFEINDILSAVNRISKIEKEKNAYLKKLEEAQKEYNLKNTLLDTAIAKKEVLRGQVYKANMDYLSFKAETDEIKYLFETEKLHLEETPVHYQYKYLYICQQ